MAETGNNSRRRGRRRTKNKQRRGMSRMSVIGAICLALVLWAGWQSTRYLARYKGETAWVYIPAGADAAAVGDSLRSALGTEFGNKVAALWSGDAAASRGAYRVQPGQRAWRVARDISRGRQTPVRVTFNNVRTLDQLAERMAARLDFNKEQFLGAVDSIARAEKIGHDTFATYFLPDTYEAFWTVTPNALIGKFRDNHDRFWTPERRRKAAALGLSPARVAIVASIAEEESANAVERPVIGRLYINRLHRNMRLQADPTVKFATGDFAARRITGDMLRFPSPYNTYRVDGLPPGPIRLASARTNDVILDSAPHNYIYMCAKADFSGTHAFAADYATHQANARAYHRALNERNLHR